MKADLFDKLEQTLSEQSVCALTTDTETGAQCLVTKEQSVGELDLSADHSGVVAQMMDNDLSGAIEDTTLFVRVYGPAPRMIVVGAVHIAQALVPMAQMAGFDVTVIDPRESFIRAGRLKDVSCLTAWPDEGMAQLAPDSRTAIVTLTHDPKLDDPALIAALNSAAFYIGSLGSKRTHAKRLSRLKTEGFTDNDIERLHGPVGLDIKAKTPSEIAVAILAQVIETRRRLQ